MISNPDLIHYACISRKNTVLAEFSRNSDIAALARRCIEKTPPYHSMYTHTVRQQSYTFLIDEPLVFFAISDEFLSLSECLRFLNRLKSAFGDRASKRRSESFYASGCFQSEFDSILREIMTSESSNSVNSTPSLSSLSQCASLDGSKGHKIGFTPLLGAKICKGLNLNLKKKKRLYGETNGGDIGKETAEDSLEVFDDEKSLPPLKVVSGGGSGDRQKAKQVWRKHVWVVLLLDLFVCAVLFGIWLWVCRGFKCIDN